MTQQRLPGDPTVGDPTIGEVLPEAQWTATAREHAARADRLIGDHLARTAAGLSHPVEDFLFSYYSWRPAQLRRWHPGVGVGLLGRRAQPRAAWRHHTTVATPQGPAVILDPVAYLAQRGAAVRFVHDLQTAIAGRPPALGCFGLHEWAMVYQQDDAARRHSAWPLRLGRAGTDEVVREHRIRCTHHDAFRFFTEAARPLNTVGPAGVGPTRRTQVELEQPGCLHATMDLYKCCYKLGPAVPSDLVLDCFELARDVREVDMRASPYDLSELGYPPIPIETPAGKAAYAQAQREMARRAEPLRHRLIAVCAQLLDPCAILSPSCARR